MGDLIRQYWIPFFLASDLDPDGPPARVRLLGEDLITFRASSGQVGLVGNHCPHRGASLFFGRNEESGLRCVYHGWKFDVTGACVDMPNEPPESNFKHKIQHTAYPCRERNGLVWAYMGPLAEPPDLPRVEWNLVPADQCYYSIRIADENFMQAVEGEYDNTHNGLLHRRFPGTSGAPQAVKSSSGFYPGMYYRYQTTYAQFSVIETDYGVLIGAARPVEGDNYYWRTYPFSMPFYTPIAPQSQDGQLSGHAWVPMDDKRTICLCFSYNPERSLTEGELRALRYGVDGLQGLHPTVDTFYPPSTKPYGRYWPRLDNGNDYGLDYEAQRTTRFSGLPGTWPQDSGMQQSMGFIYDRTKEHLGTADTGQIAIRRRLLTAARALREEGTPPPGALEPNVYFHRPAEAIVPRSEPNWIDATIEHHKAGEPLLHYYDGAARGP
jgi:phenylpropionate dioxygenase-like ring-hydroxylating dioxygenase large terminal subunit